MPNAYRWLINRRLTAELLHEMYLHSILSFTLGTLGSVANEAGYACWYQYIPNGLLDLMHSV